MKHSFYLETLGCAKNRVDSEIMLGTLLESSFQFCNNPAEAEIIIINTCGFISSAVNESLDRIIALAEYKKKSICSKIIVAGCLTARFKKELMDEIPEIDGLIGTSDYTQILPCVLNVLENNERQNFCQSRPSYSENNFTSKRLITTQYFAFLKIAEGCSNRCSFCNIPTLRGGFESRSKESVGSELKRLLSMGIKEINLISQDTSSYGLDLTEKTNLFSLVKFLLDLSKDEFWIRIFYSYPNLYPVELFELMHKDPRLVPYVDMPFQHYSNPVLKSMNRRITEREIENIIDRAMEANDKISLRTTLMVGFPNETEKDFEKMVGFVEKGYFQNIGVFTYSHEDNTTAAKFEDKIPEKVKKERKDIIMEAQQKVSLKKNRSVIGQTQQVLIEGEYEETGLLLKGRNKYQGPDVDGVVLINGGTGEVGKFNDVRITEAHPYDLVGEII